MELKYKTTKVFASEGIISSTMGVEAETADLLCFYLRDKTYTDKIKAPIREYIANAWDAHVQVGNTTSWVDVRLDRNQSLYTWSVRDFGPGLDEEDIRNVFGIYGKSTKRDSNLQIGAFGIGAMSAFAYTDTYQVESFHNGTKKTYICTLGAGQFGVEVGEIFKVSEEPTVETGIRISFDVSKDHYSFNVRTKELVLKFSSDAKIRFTDYCKYEYVPEQPIETHVNDNGVVVNLMDESSGYAKEYSIRMGGIIYHTVYNYRGNGIYFRGPIIVDVPIGSLDLPTSRETIELTQKNTKVLKTVEETLDSLLQTDKQDIPDLKLGAATIEFEAMGQHQGLFFKGYKQYFYTDLIGAVSYIQWVGPRNSIYTDETKNGGKLPIYVFPDIKNTNNWHKRLENALKIVKSNYLGYAFLNKSHMEAILKLNIDHSDCLFVDIKSLKLPKLETVSIDKTEYKVYCVLGRYREEYLSAEGLENHVNSKYPINNTEDDDGNTTTQNPWYNDPELTMNKLYARTIGLVSKYGTRNSFTTTHSAKFISSMLQLGWLNIDSNEYRDALKVAKGNEELVRQKERIESNVRCSSWGDYINSRTTNIILNTTSSSRNYDRILNVWSKILKEDSFRGKLLKNYEGCSSWNRTKFSRDELRRILTMK